MRTTEERQADKPRRDFGQKEAAEVRARVTFLSLGDR
jgi:hypothetical protein